jgi:hypothetical protein
MTGNNEPPRVYEVGELSPDGAHFWDGSTWKSAISADGRYKWDGSNWQPIMAAPSGQPASAAPPKQSHTTRNVVIAVVVLLLFGGCITVAAVSGGSKSSSSSTPTPAATKAATSTPVAQATTPKAPPPPKYATFKDGTLQIGKDIQPGTYRMRQPSSGCYFARLGGFSGSLNDILANDNPRGAAVVDILPGDKGFQSQRCGEWSADVSSVLTDHNAFGDGDFIVGTDIQPGTYRNDGSSGCYWARLANFTHGLDAILANDNPQGQAVVTISPGDKGFETSRCGKWTKIG